MKEIKITQKDEGRRLSKYLCALMKNETEGFVYKMLRKKNITLNHSKANGKEILQTGDILNLYFSEESYLKLTGTTEAASLPSLDPNRIVYEDQHLLIYNKPAGLLSQSDASKELSACEYLNSYLLKKGLSDPAFHPSFVNRLDRNTTGLMLAAKDIKAAKELSGMLRDRTIKKEYLCLVKGRIEKPAELSAYLTQMDFCNKVSISESGNSKDRIETAYTPLRFYDKINGTVLCVDLKTGRKHQIRAHLAYTGHPVAGDGKYGDQSWNAQLKRDHAVTHQLLHSYRVTFTNTEGILSYLNGQSFFTEPDQELLKYR